MSLLKLVVFASLLTVVCSQDLEDSLGTKAINSAYKIVNYFKDNFRDANIDGIFGLHAAEGQLAAFLDQISQKCTEEERSKFKNILTTLQNLRSKMENVSELGTPVVKKKYPEYFRSVGHLLHHQLWKFWAGHQNTSKELIYVLKNEVKFDEALSDGCLNEWKIKKCEISLHCWKYATEADHVDYYITHQYLYLLIGKLFGCEKEMDALAQVSNKTTTTQIFKILCSNILRESEALYAQRFRNDSLYQDLFMEQIGLCGILGYHEFIQPKWIEKIIDLQDPSGCFTDGSKRKLPSNPKKRSKREEKVMADGCLSHKTTVALLALQQTIRFRLEPSFQISCHGWK